MTVPNEPEVLENVLNVDDDMCDDHNNDMPLHNIKGSSIGNDNYTHVDEGIPSITEGEHNAISYA